MRTGIDRFALMLTALATGGPVIAQTQQATAPDRTYELSVVMGDGLGTFRDCATFRSDHGLVLHAANGLIVDWMLDETDAAGRRFQAVTDGSRAAANPIGLALHGSFRGGDAIGGDAINDRGLTFTFTGRLNRECDLGALRYENGGPYAASPTTPVVFEPNSASVAGRTYGVRLYGAEVPDDCLRFAINGQLTAGNGATFTWRMNRLNDAEGTFQAIAGPGASAGRALHGELMSWGELRVLGIESDVGELRHVVGSGRETANCIDE